jgi:hypothetical protein
MENYERNSTRNEKSTEIGLIQFHRSRWKRSLWGATKNQSVWLKSYCSTHLFVSQDIGEAVDQYIRTRSMFIREQNLAKWRFTSWSSGLKQRLITRHVPLEYFWILKGLSKTPFFELWAGFVKKGEFIEL